MSSEETIFIEKKNREVLIIDLYSKLSLSKKLGRVNKKWYTFKDLKSYESYGVFINPFLTVDFPDRHHYDVYVLESKLAFLEYYESSVKLRAVALFTKETGIRYTPDKIDMLRPFIQKIKNKYPIQ